MTDIVFEPFTPTEIVGEILGRFAPMRAVVTNRSPPYAIGQLCALTGANTNAFIGQINGRFAPMRALLTDEQPPYAIGRFNPLSAAIFDAPISPSVTLLYGALGALTGTLTGSFTIHGTINATFAGMRGVVTNRLPPYAIGELRPVTALILRALDYVGGVSALQDPGYVVMSTTDDADESPIDTLLFDDFVQMHRGIGFNETVTFTESLHGKGVRHQRIADAVSFDDLFFVVNRMVLADNISLDDVSSFTLNKFLALADMLVLQPTVSSKRHAIMLVAVAAYLSDLLRTGVVLQMSEALALQALADARVTALVKMLETLDFDDTLSMRLHAILHATSSTHLADAVTAARAARMGLIEQMVLGGVFRFAGLDYTIYAMTTVGAAVSEYQGWQFNSMCVIDGVAYGANDVGLDALEGPDDNGTPIAAFARLGLSTLGTSLYKACPAVYIGYTGTGRLLLKAITTDRGVKKENWYALNPIAKTSDANARFDPSKGLHSVYWDFEISNIDGEDFELDFVEVWRMALNRRKR